MFRMEEDAPSYTEGEIIIKNGKVPPEQDTPEDRTEEEPPGAARTGDGRSVIFYMAFAGICISTAAGAFALHMRKRGTDR